jgi:hypothetical protein
MPICRAAGKLIHFAHVPKCAGTAVEKYLEARFGALGMIDRRFGARSPAEAWSLSPPQHMPEAVRRDLLPDSLFDAQFAIVRHPAARLRSVFLFQREIERALPPRMGFVPWLKTLPRTLALDPYALHGHLRPMVETVPEPAQLFRLEDGLDAVVDWLDDLTGDPAGEDLRQIAPDNVLAARMKHLGRDMPDLRLTPVACALVAEIYAEDYTRFGYAVEIG